MAVVWLVVYVDLDANRARRGWQQKTRRNNGNEQNFCLIMTLLTRAGRILANTFPVARDAC
jgi:hypothetical protein